MGEATAHLCDLKSHKVSLSPKSPPSTKVPERPWPGGLCSRSCLGGACGTNLRKLFCLETEVFFPVMRDNASSQPAIYYLPYMSFRRTEVSSALVSQYFPASSIRRILKKYSLNEIMSQSTIPPPSSPSTLPFIYLLPLVNPSPIPHPPTSLPPPHSYSPSSIHLPIPQSPIYHLFISYSSFTHP